MLSIIATSLSIVSLPIFPITNVSGQTGTDCSPACTGCNGDAPGCQDALDQGCQYDFDTDLCERLFCGLDCRLCDGDAPGCDDDPSCWYVPDNEQCRLKDTCGSDCTFCDNNQTCATEGAGGDNVCFIATTGPNAGTCVGTTCDTDCELCDSGIEAQCTGSRAAPNGCVFDASEGCSAATRNPTSAPTPSPTPTPTDNPSEFPTTGNPTEAPNVSPLFIRCGETRDRNLPQNDVQFFGLIITPDTTRVVISTCFAFTTFATKLELFDGDGNLIDSDQGGCATGTAAEIDIPNGLPSSAAYDLEVSGVDSSQFGLYRIEIRCETAEPTASPTTSEPTGPPTGTQTTIAPTGSPTAAPTKGPTPEPTPKPSPVPTTDPTFEPTTAEPSDDPSPSPTDIPTNAPTGAPTPPPTNKPTTSPTASPTPEPTENPTTAEPTPTPTDNPTMEPIEQQCPDCAFEATLVEIGDVEVKNCTDESGSVSGSDSDSDSDSDSGGRRNYWNKRQRGDDSSDRRRLLSDSDSSDSSSGYAPWNKRCIYPKGSGSGSSSSSDSDSGSKDRRRSLLGRRSYSESSDGTDQGDDEEDDGGYSDWYTEKCFGDEDGSGSDSSDSKSYSRDRRRRRMTGSSFDGWGTRRQRTGRSLLGSDSDSDSSSGSSSNGYATWSKDDEFITEVCITYNVTDLVEDDALDCGQVRNLFLGICENNQTDFNSSTIDAEDINNLIVSISPNDTLTAEGATDEDGTLGVFISFAQDSGVEQFELCLGNVTVDSDFNDNKEMIEIGNGTIRIRQDGEDDKFCPSDGLPCLNFFFDTPCPEVFTTTDDGKSCDCMGGITEFTARYDGECTASSITVYRKSNLNTAVCTFNNVSPGDEITCASSSAGKDRFKWSTHIVVICDDESKSNMERRLLSSDSGDGDDSDCTAKFKTRCQTQIVGTQSEGCSDFTMISTIDREGGFCDEDELNKDDGSSGFNALAVGELSINDPLEAFTSLDPYIQYTLIGLMVTFVVLMFVACYICIGKDKLHKNKNEDIKDNMEDDINDMNKHTSWSEYGGINQTKTDLVDDDDEDEECYLSDNGQTHQQINTVDDSDDDDYYETNAGQQVEMEIMKNVSSQ